LVGRSARPPLDLKPHFAIEPERMAAPAIDEHRPGACLFEDQPGAGQKIISPLAERISNFMLRIMLYGQTPANEANIACG
jgi:hypothetical protein